MLVEWNEEDDGAGHEGLKGGSWDLDIAGYVTVHCGSLLGEESCGLLIHNGERQTRQTYREKL